MGYPQLDLLVTPHEVSIIEFENAPIIPCLTKWRRVIKFGPGFPISYEIFRKEIKACDPTQQEIWDREQEKTKKEQKEKEDSEKHTQEMADNVAKIVRKSDFLQDRIAKAGIKELFLDELSKQVPKNQLKELSKK